MFKTGRRIFLINAQNPASTFLSHIALCISIPNNWMLRITRGTPFNQRRILLHYNECMLNRDSWHFDTQHFCCALSVIARSRNNMLSRDNDLLFRRYEITTLFHHLGAGDFPMRASPMECVRLPFSLNCYTMLPCTFSHRHSHISGINITVRFMIDCTFEIICPDQRPFNFDFLRRHKLVRNTASFCRRRIEPIFIHSLFSLRHS